MKRLIVLYSKYVSRVLVVAVFLIPSILQSSEKCFTCFDDCFGDVLPLECGKFDTQFQAGIAPIVWRHRPDFQQVHNLPANVNATTVTLFDIPRFKHFFHLPWIIGGQIGYAWSEHVRFYLDANYTHAKSRHDGVIINSSSALNPNQNYEFFINAYQEIDLYIGARYYTNRLWQRVSLFGGGKLGFVHRDGIHFNFEPIASSATPAVQAILFKKNNVISGGINGGIDVSLCDDWSWVFTVEMIVNAGPKNTFVMQLMNAAATASDFFIGRVKTEFRFPITFALRYRF